MERLAGRVILLWGWRRALLAFLAGALAVLAQAPYDFFAVGFLSFPVLVWLLDGATVASPAGFIRRLTPAFATGWWFGFGYFLAGLWWIGNAFLIEAEDFAWALPIAVVGLPIMLAVFYGLAAAIARLFWSNNIGRIAALALGFGLAEWLRSFVLSGFPWNAIGYAAMPLPLLMQSASVTGLVGMNALTVFVFALPALFAAQRDRRIGFVLALLLCAAHAGFGYWRLTQPEPEGGKTLAVRIVQPSVDMAEKFDPAAQDRSFGAMMEQSAKAPEAGKPKPQLILWPETSVPFLFTDRPDALTALGSMLSADQILIAGAVRSENAGADRQERFYNSVVAIDQTGQIVDAVDKVHLVPFGEYLPFSDLLERIGFEQIVAGPMNFNGGGARHAISLPGAVLAVPFICYEIIFPDLVAADSTTADVIVNVTNDGWFGNSAGPYQHLRQAQLRAVETGLPVLRAANTGISAIIDPYGRVVDALAMNARGTIDSVVRLPPRAPRLIPPVRLIGFAILGLFAFIALAMRLRQRIKSN